MWNTASPSWSSALLAAVLAAAAAFAISPRERPEAGGWRLEERQEQPTDARDPASATYLLPRASSLLSASDVRPIVGLLPSQDAAVTREIADGATLALEQARDSGGPVLTLVVGSTPTQWASSSAEAVRLACEAHAVALIAPPERTLAHLVAQAVTRCSVPMISTCRAPSVTAAGSRWVASAVTLSDAALDDARLVPPEFDAASPAAAAFGAAFRRRFGREPVAWSAAGFDAARIIVEAVRRAGMSRARFVAALLDATPITGADASMRFDRSLRRESAGN